MIYFWDTSALIKRYITEIGSNWVRQTIVPSAGNDAMIAQITPVELYSVLARRRSEKTISPRTARAAQLLIERHIRREYVVLTLSGGVLETAQSLVDKHIMRGYDAVQLATALEMSRRLGAGGLGNFIFVTADKRLLKIATSEGFIIQNPENYP